MSMNIEKGARVDLTKNNPNLDQIMVGLGWSPRKNPGEDFDLDAMAFLLGANGKCRKDTDWVFYNNLVGDANSVKLGGDNRTGVGDGDDEKMRITLSKVPADVSAIDVAITIYKADDRHQNFGQVDDAYIRIIDNATGAELLRYDLTEDYSTETAVVVGQFYRKDGGWKFVAKADGKMGTNALRNEYGV